MPANPSRIVTPWYDSKAISLMGLILMAAFFLFALIGISVACETPEYRRHIFIPLALMLVSLGGLVIFAFRLAKRSLPKGGS